MSRFWGALYSVTIILAVAGFVAFIVAYQIGLWNECRETNSFGYCWRVLSK